MDLRVPARCFKDRAVREDVVPEERVGVVLRGGCKASEALEKPRLERLVGVEDEDPLVSCLLDTAVPLDGKTAL